MSTEAEEIGGEGSPETEQQFPAQMQGVPKNAQSIANAIRALPSKERASLFKAFNKPLPSERKTTHMERDNGANRSAMMRVSAEMWEGPLPSPGALARYNEISPGLAEKIVNMAQDQQAHRFGLENRTVDSQLSQSKRGQYFALTLGLVAIGAATYLGLTDHAIVAGIIAGPTIIGFAAMFIVGKIQEGTSRKIKAQSATPAKSR
jgi:uncharacterized membrane protein